MKLVTFREAGGFGAGYVEGDQVVVCAEGGGAETAVRGLIEQGAAGMAAWTAKGAGGARRLPLAQTQLTAPMPALLRDVLCVGKNYYAHAAEFHGSGFDSSGKEEVPSAPVIFTKATTSVVGPNAVVRGSLDPTGSVDYEVELGVVIGQRAFKVPKERAYDVVFGYVIVNDVTSRELQRKHSQWTIGKSIDSFCPMGPWIATADEIGDPTKMTVETRINGELRQQASVADLIFDIPTLIATLTATMTLLPGDVIATGTPAGVGLGFKPPKYLVEGDRMALSITGLGVLENPIG